MLTPEDLAAIRDRHTDAISPQWDENGNVIGQWCNECDAKWPCDAYILLAEVDRLLDVVDAVRAVCASPLHTEEMEPTFVFDQMRAALDALEEGK